MSAIIYAIIGAGVAKMLLSDEPKKRKRKRRISEEKMKRYISLDSRETFLFETEHFDENGKMQSVKLQGLVPKDKKSFWTKVNNTKWKVVYAKSNDDWDRDGYRINQGDKLKLYTMNGSNPVYFPTQKDFETHMRIYGRDN
ncbi:MAG: hypothetical protein IPL26_30030 [Leptospiraceae bacterium]|nr:hypothetical protein [Leptospiraceae bacterium]